MQGLVCGAMGTDLLPDKLFDESETALRAINPNQSEYEIMGLVASRWPFSSLRHDEILNNGFESVQLQAEIALSNAAADFICIHAPT
jgi:hypothetical protein